MLMKAQEAGGRVLGDEAASRAAYPVYHTGQGQDEQAEAHPSSSNRHLPLHGLDSVWSWRANPHRESGTRAAADVGQADRPKPVPHGRQIRRGGNRLGDSVGRLGGSLPMDALSHLKGGSLIAFVLEPHRVDIPHPDVGQGAHRHTLTLALFAFALLGGQGPGLLLGGLPSKLLQHIAQRFDAGVAFVRFGVVPTCLRHRRGAGQSLDAGRIGVACAIIAPFCQQPQSQSLACTWKTAERITVGMRQKKGRNLLILGGNLLDERDQLADQRQHQTRFGTGGDRISLQVGLLKRLPNLPRDLGGVGMMPLTEHRFNLCHRSSLSCLRGGIHLQEDQRRVLVQFRKELQRHRVVRFKASCQLVDQARLTLDQRILVTAERFEFSHQRTIRFQSPQVSQVGSARFRQQVGIDRIGFGSRGLASAIDGLGIDRIDRKAGIQQSGNEQPMSGFDDAGQLLLGGRTSTEKSEQLRHPFWRVADAQRRHLLTNLINDQGIMMLICPVDSSIPHAQLLSESIEFLGHRVLLHGCSQHDPLMVDPAQECRQGSSIFVHRPSREEKIGFLWRLQCSKYSSCCHPRQEGLVLV